MDEVTRILIFTTLFTVSATVLLILSLTISRRRSLQHKKQLLEKEYKTREEALLQISRDLHDDIGSSLSGINMLSQLAQQQIKLDDKANTTELLEKINIYTNEVIEKVGDMAWLLKPNEESLSMLFKKLKAFSNAAASKNIGVHFEALPETPQKVLDIRQRKAIYLISKEAINNAVKYAECKNLYCRFYITLNNVLVQIEDDGKGFDISCINYGNGLINMKARAGEIGGELSVKSITGKGTMVELKF